MTETIRPTSFWNKLAANKGGDLMRGFAVILAGVGAGLAINQSFISNCAYDISSSDLEVARAAHKKMEVLAKAETLFPETLGFNPVASFAYYECADDAKKQMVSYVKNRDNTGSFMEILVAGRNAEVSLVQQCMGKKTIAFENNTLYPLEAKSAINTQVYTTSAISSLVGGGAIASLIACMLFPPALPRRKETPPAPAATLT